MCYNYFAAVFNGGKFKKGVTYMTRHMKKYLSLALAAAVSGMSAISVNAAEETKSGGKLSYYTYIGGCAKLDEIIGNIGNIKDFFTPTEKDDSASDNTETPDTPEIPESGTVSEYEIRVVELVNEIREEYGLSKLTLNSELSDVARLKSQDMHDNNYFSHTSPTYGSPYDMMTKYGIKYTFAGENLARGQKTPEQVVNAWMNSSGHRKNILSERYTQIGVGYVADGNYWTQHFIG